jgi:hypothetical protein
MNPTITFTGARGGHGTTTVAAAVAVHAARTRPTTLVSPDTAAAMALLGLPGGAEHAPIDVLPTLTVAADIPETSTDHGIVVDAGTLAARSAGGLICGRNYLVLRGPCYVALASVLAAGVAGLDGVVIVAEAQRSLTAADVADVLGLPVVATVNASPQVARTIDAGLFFSRLIRLNDLASLRSLADPHPARRPPSTSPPMTHTDLPLSHSDNGREGLACRDRALRNHVSESTDPATGAACAQHRTTRLRRRRVLHRRDRHLGGGLLLGAR